MRISRSRWHVACAVLWVCARSAWTHPGSDVGFSEIDDLTRGNGYERKLIPIKSPRVHPTRYATRRMPLEPDAEVLPAHYTRVQPPGVDHMELKFAETQVSKAGSDMVRISGTSDDGSGTRASETESKTGHRRTDSVEKAQKGEKLRTKQKTETSEAGGKKKTQSESGSNSGQEKIQVSQGSGESYKKKDAANVDRKASGFRNVYHKDEYKKDHDFYDNDDHGGHLKKHGRYKEKHVATEGTFKKGDGKDSIFGEVELRKEGVAGNSQVEDESKGHDARRGYDGFFGNFQGFAKHDTQAKGEGFRFKAKTR